MKSQKCSKQIKSSTELTKPPLVSSFWVGVVMFPHFLAAQNSKRHGLAFGLGHGPQHATQSTGDGHVVIGHLLQNQLLTEDDCKIGPTENLQVINKRPTIPYPYSIHGTGGVFTYIWLIFYGKCMEIYHTWMVWASSNTPVRSGVKVL